LLRVISRHLCVCNIVVVEYTLTGQCTVHYNRHSATLQS
jgi:hypothetical protein